MKSTKELLVLVALSLVALLGAPSNAAADDFICSTPPAPPASGTYDNVVVPPGAFCFLLGATVRGNVTVLENAILVMGGATTVGGNVKGLEGSRLNLSNLTGGNIVHGNIQADKAARATIFGGSVGGNIEIKDGIGAGVGLADYVVCGVSLPNGNIHIEKNRGRIHIGIAFAPPFGCGINSVANGNVKVEDNYIVEDRWGLRIENNNVSQNLQVSKNSGPGPKSVVGNFVDDTIQCTENSAPFIGGPNTAPKIEGQCF